MTAEFRKVNLAMQSDPEFRALPPPAQHLYYTLWCRSDLSYCGVLDWRPGRIAATSAGWGVDVLLDAARCLEARYFIVTDDVTEECLIRSWVRFDGLMKQPRMAVAFAASFHAVSSETIRGVIVHETRKLKDLEPNLTGWGKPSVQEVLSFPTLDPRSREVVSDPFGDGFGDGFGDRFGGRFAPGLGQTLPGVWVPPTTTTTTTTKQTATTTSDSTLTRTRRARFDEFYSLYPKKAARGAAKKAWDSAVTGTDPDVIISGLRRLLPWFAAQTRDGKDYRPAAGPWLNQERWLDEPEGLNPTSPYADYPAPIDYSEEAS